MFFLVIAGLAILLTVLVFVRSTQQNPNRPGDHSATQSPNPAEPAGHRSSASAPPDEPVAAVASDSNDYYLWESRRIALRGEARAGTLDFFGYLISGFAALVVLGAFLAILNTDGELATSGRVAITLGTAGSVLTLVAMAAMFFGFGALVRNTSRSLAISAGAALDSFGPTGEE